MLRPALLAPALALLLAAPACKKPAEPLEQARVSVAEAEELGKKMANALGGTCSPGIVGNLVDIDSLVISAAAQRGIDTKAARGMAAGAKTTFGTSLCSNIANEDVLRLLRVRMVGGKARALIRITGETGINYFELSVGKREGQIRAHDIYIFTTGQQMSEVMADMLAVLKDGRAGMDEAVKFRDAMTKLQQLVAQQKFEDARSLLKSLPPKLRQTKAVMLTDVTVASNLPTEIYIQTIEAYEKRFPQDPSLDLVSIDGFFLKKDYGKALEAVERLDKRVGGDPYLNVFRAQVAIEQKKLEEARTLLTKALEEEPDMVDAMWALVMVALLANDHKEVVELLVTLQNDFKQAVNRGFIETDPTYATFAASPEGKAYLSTL